MMCERRGSTVCLMGHMGLWVKRPVWFLLTGPVPRRSQPATFSPCHTLRVTLPLSPLLFPGACPQLRSEEAGKTGFMARDSWNLYPRNKKAGRFLPVKVRCPLLTGPFCWLIFLSCRPAAEGPRMHYVSREAVTTAAQCRQSAPPQIPDGGHKTRGKKPWAQRQQSF